MILSTVLPFSSANRTQLYYDFTEAVVSNVGVAYSSSNADAVNDYASILNNSSYGVGTAFRNGDGHPTNLGYQIIAQKTLQTLTTLPTLPTSTGFLPRAITLLDENGIPCIGTSSTGFGGYGGRALYSSYNPYYPSLTYDALGYRDPISGAQQYGVQINDYFGETVMTFPDSVGSSYAASGNYWSVYGSYTTNSLKMKANGSGSLAGTNVNIEFVPKGTGQVLLDGGTIATGNVISDTLGSGLQVKEGTNGKQGTATLSGGTVTISDTAVTANSRIFLTVQSLGTVTTPAVLAVTARTAGTSFTVTSSASNDTSTFAYEILEPAP